MTIVEVGQTVHSKEQGNLHSLKGKTMTNKVYPYAMTLVVLMLSIGASAKPGGWGLGLGGFDGDFGLQGRKDLTLGESGISEFSFQGSLIVQNKTTIKLDADYHHIFTPDGPVRLYPLGGLQFAVNSNSNRFGLNLGGGLNVPFSEKVDGFLEFKYTFGDWDGFTLVGGVRF
ncbi:hypothetical protein ACFL6U_23685 [Planctomycetota bacterium]